MGLAWLGWAGLGCSPPGLGRCVLTWLGGPISASVLSGSYTYRMSPKWASSFGSAIDLTGRNIGQNFQLVRIGESFLMTFGFNVDYSRNNVGFTFNLEPRFLSRTQFASRTGLDIPMAGAYGLE